MDLMKIIYKKDSEIPKTFSLLRVMTIGVRLEKENYNEGIEKAAELFSDKKIKQQILMLKKK